MPNPILIEVNEASAVGEVRRAATSLAGELGLGEDVAGRLPLIATELATNLVKHATGGIVIILPSADGSEVEVLALDTGPGIPDVARALRDGHSSTATSGTGLGAISRLSDFFDLYSARGLGTAVLARVAEHALKGAACIAAISAPLRNEQVNGDGWDFVESDGTLTVMLVDGLGHGFPAHEAALAASEAFHSAKGAPAEILRTIHEALRRTRGAAVAIAELHSGNGAMRFAGVGNISATMIDSAARRSAVSLYGIVGHDVREFREFSYPWSRESSLIMHSDGLTTRWDLDRYPGLLTHDPALIAGVLWKDHRRQNDDSTVIVARTP